jgi:GxxExxY protein
MTENELATIIVDFCYQIHKSLGPGLFESVYEEILSYELTEAGLNFTRQTQIPVYYKNLILKPVFRADLIVEEKVIIEIKSIESIASVHKKQLLTYLKLTGLKLGLLVNFNESLIKDGITRIVNNL